MNARASPATGSGVQPLLSALDELQTLVSAAIRCADWRTAAACLEVQADLHARSATGLERLAYARAARIASNHALPGKQRLVMKAAAAVERVKQRRGAGHVSHPQLKRCGQGR